MKETIKKGLIFGITAGLSMLVIGISYAAFTTITTVNPTDALTAAKFNEVINKLNAIDEKALATAWVNFDGTSCLGGSGGNECSIGDSYNILKVIKSDEGKFDIYFETNMDNANYSPTIGFGDFNRQWNGGHALSYIGGTPSKTVNSFSVHLSNNSFLAYSYKENNFVIFGGKN